MLMEPESLRLLLWGLFSLFGFVVFVFILRNISQLRHGSSSPSPSPSHTPTALSWVMRAMSFSLLRSATCDFNGLNLIKVGHSGEFFTGYLHGEENIIVKKGTAADLVKELELHLSLSDRRSLVPLLGYCEEDKDALYLVYQFMKEGDLATLLARKDRPLPWIVRLRIARELSEALLFLHYTCTPPILHNDIKGSSILMGENYEVRLGSLNRAMRVEQEGLLRYDVWCFGMLLMDLISGLDVSGAMDPYAQIWLQKAIACTEKGGLLGLIDPSLVVEEDLAQEIIGVFKLARGCLNGSSLITMKRICQALEQPAHISEIEVNEEYGLSPSEGKYVCNLMHSEESETDTS